MSPISAMPQTSAENSSGTISMKIRLRKILLKGVVTYLVTSCTQPASPWLVACTMRPTIRPTPKPMAIFQCSGRLARVAGVASVISGSCKGKVRSLANRAGRPVDTRLAWPDVM